MWEIIRLKISGLCDNLKKRGYEGPGMVDDNLSIRWLKCH